MDVHVSKCALCSRTTTERRSHCTTSTYTERYNLSRRHLKMNMVTESEELVTDEEKGANVRDVEDTDGTFE